MAKTLRTIVADRIRRPAQVFAARPLNKTARKRRPASKSGSLPAPRTNVNEQSYPIQDEPEGEVGFQHKMSLEGVASWRIDNQRARSREIKSGSDPGFSTSQPNHPIRGRKPTPGLPLDRTGAVPPAVPPTKPRGARTDPALS